FWVSIRTSSPQVLSVAPFFPFLFTMSGITADFVRSFPWAVLIILMISLLVAELIVPFLQFYFIRRPIKSAPTVDGKKPFSFLDSMQRFYDKVLDLCFHFPKTTLAIGVLSVAIGAILYMRLPQQLMPIAERNQFAVEIYMPTGTAVEKTSLVADSLEHILRDDSRVVSVASFKGCSSPRFQNSYAPQQGGSNFAQFIVNTTGNDATEQLLDDYTARCRSMFPEAVVRFKQLSFSEAASPIEVRLSGNDLAQLHTEAKRIESLLRSMPELNLVRTDLNEQLAATRITLDEDYSTRMGITNAGVEATMAMRYGSGITVGTLWEGDYDIDVVMKSNHADYASFADVQDEPIPAAAGLANVPLRQVATVEPTWQFGQIPHRNGMRTVTVMAEVERGLNVMQITHKVQRLIADSHVAEGISVAYGGEIYESEEQMPSIIGGLVLAIAIIFFILVFHFKRIGTAVLMLLSLTLCFFGMSVGVMVQGVNFGLTCILGLVSLMGILVRNGIIMIDYAEELRRDEHLHVREAIYHSAKRRMRPIFLTSAAASMGVIPMILGGSSLWMPMGTVIFYGTLITMLFILTVLPVAYWMTLRGSTRRRAMMENLEKE
ncbi:MAG: efflux RND transporter permease subunit, partial [Muribaculaceae bacterium]